MKSFKIHGRKPNEVIELVREMRNAGMVQGKDFDFSYSPSRLNQDDWTVEEPSKVEFAFYKEQWASWFVLRFL